MFELKDLPSYETLASGGAIDGNPDVNGLHTWLIWASATSDMLSAFDANLARISGLSQTQFFVLALLKRNPDGLSLGTLASGVAVTSQTMTRAIDRMEAAGLCRREADLHDRRAWLVRLTPAGDEKLTNTLPEHYAWVTRLMSHLNDDERQMLNQLMLKLSRSDALPPRDRTPS